MPSAQTTPQLNYELCVSVEGRVARKQYCAITEFGAGATEPSIGCRPDSETSRADQRLQAPAAVQQWSNARPMGRHWRPVSAPPGSPFSESIPKLRDTRSNLSASPRPRATDIIGVQSSRNAPTPPGIT